MSRDIEIANIKEAMNGADNKKMITPYSLNQVIKRKAGSGSSTPGVGLNYYWNGTELGVKREDEQDYAFVDLQGPAGTNGSDGEDGKEIELQVTATHIQWRYVGDISWLNLIALSLLKGADGADGVDGTNGVDGEDGLDGKQVLLQKSATHIQWKYDTDVTWTNLVALVDLKGADGTNGTNGSDGSDGITPHIDPTTKHWFIGTTDTGILAEGTNGTNGADGEDGADGQGVPVGGTTGQVLKKKTNTDFDTEWGEAASVLVKATGSEVIAGTNDEKYVTPKAIKDGMMVSGDTLPIGAVQQWYSDIIPDNWLLANGQAVSRATYSELFTLWGTAFGVGDGSTTFNVIDMRDYTPIGKSATDTNINVIGKKYGEKAHKLTTEDMPAHTHNTTALNLSDAGYLPTNDNLDANCVINYSATLDMTERGWSNRVAMISAGEDQYHNNMQPSVATNFIIKAKQSAGVVATVVDNLTSTSSTDALSAGKGKELNDRLGHSIGFIGNHYITGATSAINGGVVSNWASAEFGGGDKGLDKVGVKKDLITNNAGAVLYTHDGTIEFIEVDITISGVCDGNGGIWWAANDSNLNGAVMFSPQVNGLNVLSHIANATYGCASNKYIFDVSQMAIGASFFINPLFSIYNSGFTPNGGGTNSMMTVKGYI